MATYLIYGIEVDKKDCDKIHRAENYTGHKTCLLCLKQIRDRYKNFSKHVHSCCRKYPNTVDREKKIFANLQRIKNERQG